MLLGCAQSTELTRPASLLQADRMMQRGHEAYRDADMARAALMFSRAEQRYQAYDETAALRVARVNRAYVVWTSSQLAGDHSQAVDAYRVLFAKDMPVTERADADGIAHAIRTEYSELYLPVSALTVRLLYVLQQSDAAHRLAEQMPDDALRSWMTRLWLMQQSDNSQDAAGALAAAQALLAQDAVSEVQGARLLRYRAWLAAEQGDYRLAQQLSYQAIEHYRDSYQRLGLAASFDELARWYAKDGDLARSERYGQRAQSVRGVASSSDCEQQPQRCSR